MKYLHRCLCLDVIYAGGKRGRLHRYNKRLSANAGLLKSRLVAVTTLPLVLARLHQRKVCPSYTSTFITGHEKPVAPGVLGYFNRGNP